MTKRANIYKCELCGNIVETLHAGPGELVCCNKPMKLMDEQNADFATEKHVPIIEKIENGIKVIVGSTLHPMTEDHYIEWIEVINGDYIQRKYLKPGEEPVAEFYVPFSDKLIAREYCNKHGNWISKK
jgi:superoxide reductase